MIRGLKNLSTANFLISMSVYAGYVALCLLRGIDIDHRLGVSRGHGVAWALVAFLEVQLLFSFFVQRYSDDLTTFRHRLGYIIYGVFIFFFWVGHWFHSGAIQFADFHLIGYVGFSDVAYGLLGSNDT